MAVRARGFAQATVVGTIQGEPLIGRRMNPNGTARSALTRLHIRTFARDPHTGKGRQIDEWIDVLFLGGKAETIRAFASPGTRIFACGRLERVRWTGKDGIQRREYRIVAEEMMFLDRKEYSSEATRSASKANEDTRPSHRSPRHLGAF